MLELVPIRKSNKHLQAHMASHYTKPKGFVGRQIFFLIVFAGVIYGSMAGGSATLHVPGRNEFFHIEKSQLGGIINNTFFHLERGPDNRYPTRNFTSRILSEFRPSVIAEWESRYGERVLGFETLVELPRNGDLYRRDGWTEVGVTKGYSCKRVSGPSTDGWTGRRVWDYTEIRPKLVFCRHILPA